MEINELLDYTEELIKFNDLDNAIIGVTKNIHGNSVIVYDYEKSISILSNLYGIDLQSSKEYLDFNILNINTGETTPIFVEIFY